MVWVVCWRGSREGKDMSNNVVQGKFGRSAERGVNGGSRNEEGWSTNFCIRLQSTAPLGFSMSSLCS